jgi:hypothetical protein
MSSITRPLIALLLAALLVSPACDTPSPDTSRRNRVFETQTESDEFSIAAEYLQRFSEHDANYGQRNMLYHLNQWIADQPRPEAWEADRLTGQLPRLLSQSPPAQQYDRPSFDSLDGWSLWEAAMMKRVSVWALERSKEDPLLTDWYLALEGTHGPDHVHRLKTAARLFDWTVRNIQLDPLLKYLPAEPVGSADEGGQAVAVPAPLRGIPGPGYRFEPWQVLLYGRGDAWQRARVFIRLCRQQQLEVVMLAVDDPQQFPSPRPWVPALMVDDQLYLFDAGLGLPLPGDQYTGIATLADVLAKPELLRQVDVEDHRYPIEAEQLQGVEALIDASPSELSHRMQLVESRFIGQQKLQLTVDPSALAQRLRDVPGISNVRLWPIALETILYRQVAPQMIAQNQQLQYDYIVREFIFTTPNPVAQGRWQHLAGHFDSTTGHTGAKKYYLNARNSEGTIALLAQSPQIQRQLGLRDDLDDDPDRREAQLRSVERMLLQSAQNASYWLGLINYAEDKPAVALDWLERQTLGGRNETVWETGAVYNVGRCYEQLEEYEKALANYKTGEESPSRPGQLVRAKWLEARFGN